MSADADNLSMLIQTQVAVTVVATEDERLVAIATVEGHHPRQVIARRMAGIWTAWQSIQCEDGSWSQLLRVPPIKGHPVPTTSAELVKFCRWLYEPMTHVA